jgi:hypothetical protein
VHRYGASQLEDCRWYRTCSRKRVSWKGIADAVVLGCRSRPAWTSNITGMLNRSF